MFAIGKSFVNMVLHKKKQLLLMRCSKVKCMAKGGRVVSSDGRLQIFVWPPICSSCD